MSGSGSSSSAYRTFTVVLAALAATALALSGCSPSDKQQQGGSFTLLSTTAVRGGSSMPNTLIAVDSASGAQRSVGEVGATAEQASLTWDASAGVLYGVSAATSRTIVRIDAATGATTVVTQLAHDALAVAASPAGNLYVLLGDRLFFTSWLLATVDPSSGVLSVIGQVPIATAGYAYTFLAGMDFQSDGTLYAVADQREAANFNTNVYHLLTIDPATAAVTSSLPIEDSHAIGDIACAPDGLIYATNWSWHLIRIDPRTGRNVGVGLGQLGALGGLATKR